MKMLILRGKAGKYALPGEQPRDWPRGALDEPAALEFARLRDAVVPPDLPRWLEPLRQTVRYLGWVRQRRAGGYAEYDYVAGRQGIGVHEAPAVRVRV